MIYFQSPSAKPLRKRPFFPEFKNSKSIDNFSALRTPSSFFPIVIVDDHLPDLLLGEVAIRRCSIENPIYLMKTGMEYINNFQGRWNSPFGLPPSPCMLLLDLTMPVVSGLDVLRAIRTLPLASKSNIAIVSGMLDTKKTVEAERLGVSKCVLKPLSPEDIWEMLASADDRLFPQEKLHQRHLQWEPTSRRAFKELSSPEVSF
jgi:CheY-like chemotaxis protein